MKNVPALVIAYASSDEVTSKNLLNTSNMATTNRFDRLCHFKRHFLFFFLCGQNTCLPRERIFSCVPTIFSLFVIITSEIRLTAKRFKNLEMEQGFILHCLLLCNMFPSFVAAIESFRMPNGIQIFLQTFRMIVEYLEDRTPTKINWTNVQKRINFKFIKAYLCYFVVVFFRLVIKSPVFGRRYELWSSFLWFYRSATILHAVFYIDLLRFLISSMAHSVESQRKALKKKRSFELNELIEIVNIVKYHHYQVGECLKIINDYFGPIFVAIAIDSIFTLTNTGYWFFHHWMKDTTVFVLFRKYLLNSFYSIRMILFPWDSNFLKLYTFP